MNDAVPADQPSRFRPEVVRLGLLCAVLYFAQGLCDPAAGILKQPGDSLLKNRGFGEAALGDFAFWISLPWILKLGYGFLTDFVPLFGYRRKSWLLISTVGMTATFGYLQFAPETAHTYRNLLLWLFAANLFDALGDVVIDATMVEQGQPLGVTGRLQSIQWGSMSVASALAAAAGGIISEYQVLKIGFAVCAVFSAISIGLVVLAVREERGAVPEQSFSSAVRAIGMTFRSGTILAAAAFLFLWSFNPFSAEVQYMYQGQTLGFSETQSGMLGTIQYAASTVACLAYGAYCTRVRFSLLVHLSIVYGVLSTVGYWWFRDFTSAVVITIFVGFIYMTATLIQLDLAARVCPPQIAGTVFAVLMAVSNLGTSLASKVGGALYEPWKERFGATPAFNILVATGAASTAASWLLVPFLLRDTRPAAEESPANSSET